jgi:hypothetical protein
MSSTSGDGEVSGEARVGRSRKFIFWFLGIHLLPLAGIPATWPRFTRVWVFIMLANACVFFFNLGRYHGRLGGADAKTNRFLFFAGALMWGLLTLYWGGQMAVAIYRSGSLGL